MHTPYFCARMHFKDTGLTTSIKAEAGRDLIETVEIFITYFLKEYPAKRFLKMELFLEEQDMHLERQPFQTTYF
jgi:hypothetical protein